MFLTLNKSSIEDYRKFLAVKSLPVYRITGSQAWFPDEYASRIGIAPQGFVALGGKSPKTKLRIHNPRRFYGCELKDEYFAAAQKNLKRSVKDAEAQERKERPILAELA